MIITMVIFTGEYITENAIIFTLLAISFYLLLHKIKEGKRKNKKSEQQIENKISIGFYLGTFNIIMLMSVLLLNNYRG